AADTMSRSACSPQCGQSWVRWARVLGTRAPHRQCWLSAVDRVSALLIEDEAHTATIVPYLSLAETVSRSSRCTPGAQASSSAEPSSWATLLW
ncbi:MAG: hypothetical protein JWR48_6586, partial [Mycobacterium sp.]|nr:hypothetical protein [Mycobacterium sp.]